MANAATWRKRVEEWRESGLKAKEFAENRGLSVHQLWNWAATFRKRAQAEAVEPEAAMVRSTPRAADAARADGVRLARLVRVPARDDGGKPLPLSVEFSEVRIVLPDGFDRSTFALLLDAIERRKARAGEP
jgi:transposase